MPSISPAGQDDNPRAPLDAARRAVYERLRGVPAEALLLRPAPDTWSALENVRHLLYAERKHFGKMFPRAYPWPPIALPTAGTPRRNGAGTATTDSLEEVLAAWDEVHAAILVDRVDRETLARAVDRNLRHLRSHVRSIARALTPPEV